MAFLGRRKMTVGLDVGSGLVKAVVIDHTGGTPVVTRVVLSAVADTAIVDGEILDYAMVADAIREAIGPTDLRKAHVVAAVGGRDVIVKKIALERVKAAQARELVRWEAEQHVPFEMESVELDFQILDPDAVSPDMQVLLVAAKRELVLAKQQLLQDAGATPDVIDVDAFALHNAFALNHPDAMVGTVALLNIGNEVTNLNILEDGVPILTRDLNVGTRRMRADLQQDYGMTLGDADALLRGGERSPMLDAIVGARADELAVGIERAGTFLSTSSRHFTGIRSIFVCGGGAAVPGLRALLGERLRINVVTANALARVAVRAGALQALGADDVAPLLMLPMGLALRTAA